MAYVDATGWNYRQCVNSNYDCDYKRCGDVIVKYCQENNYQIRTDIDHVIDMVFGLITEDDEKTYNVYDSHYVIIPDNLMEYLKEENLESFDYYG